MPIPAEPKILPRCTRSTGCPRPLEMVGSVVTLKSFGARHLGAMIELNTITRVLMNAGHK